MVRFHVPLLLVALSVVSPALAQQEAPSMSAAEKAQKQAANEEAETLCKSIKDQDKFNECLDLYFLDAKKFQEFLTANGAAKPTKPDKAAKPAQ